MESSTALETALAAWLAFMNQLGVDMQSYLLPPATEEQIVAVETEIGFRLPNDLRELYLIANGQTEFPYNPNPETVFLTMVFGRHCSVTMIFCHWRKQLIFGESMSRSLKILETTLNGI